MHKISKELKLDHQDSLPLQGHAHWEHIQEDEISNFCKKGKNKAQ